MLPESIKKKFEEQHCTSIREYGDFLIERTCGKKVIENSTQPKIVKRDERPMKEVGDIEEILSKW